MRKNLIFTVQNQSYVHVVYTVRFARNLLIAVVICFKFLYFQFYIRAVVHEKPDFIIIDRIIANFVDVTTPVTSVHPTQKSTSLPPTANPIVSHAPIVTPSIIAAVLIIAVKEIIT